MRRPRHAVPTTLALACTLAGTGCFTLLNVFPEEASDAGVGATDTGTSSSSGAGTSSGQLSTSRPDSSSSSATASASSAGSSSAPSSASSSASGSTSSSGSSSTSSGSSSGSSSSQVPCAGVCAQCSNTTQDSNEEGTDCGGPCGPCVGEFAVNTLTAGNQRRPELAVGNSDTFLVSWESGTTPARRGRVFMMESVADAPVAAGDDAELSPGSLPSAVSAALDEGFILAVSGNSNAGSVTPLNRFAVSGTRVAASINPGRSLDIATDSSGSVLCAGSFSGGHHSVYLFKAATDGTVQGGISTELRGFDCRIATSDAEGFFAVSHQSRDDTGTTAATECWMQVFNRAGTPQDGRLLVSALCDAPGADVATALGRDLAVVWADPDPQSDIHLRRYSKSGTPRGEEQLVNTTTTGRQYEPRVAMQADGSFVVVWTSADQDTSSNGVFAQRFLADGRPWGAEFQVNVTSFGSQHSPAAAAVAGRYLFAWTSESQDGEEGGIYARWTSHVADVTAPEFLEVLPSPLPVGQSSYARLEFLFSEPLDNPALPALDPPLLGTASWLAGGGLLRFDLTQQPLPATRYEVALPGAPTDFAGLPLVNTTLEVTSDEPAPGTPDCRLGPQGGSCNGLSPLPLGTMFVDGAGRMLFHNSNPNARTLTRLLPDGAVDPAYVDATGTLVLPAHGETTSWLAVAPSGAAYRTYVAGGSCAVERITPEGVVDAAFGTVSLGACNSALVLWADDVGLVASVHDTLVYDGGAGSVLRVWVINSDGTPQPGFNPKSDFGPAGALSSSYVVARLSDGSVLVDGLIYVNGTGSNGIWRFAADGTPFPGWGDADGFHALPERNSTLVVHNDTPYSVFSDGSGPGYELRVRVLDGSQSEVDAVLALQSPAIVRVIDARGRVVYVSDGPGNTRLLNRWDPAQPGVPPVSPILTSPQNVGLSALYNAADGRLLVRRSDDRVVRIFNRD
ncbi:MAG: hypothetical protein AB2A00_14345 [Myxococcota bacterium]